jgi:cysteinyl-tRNA synthetase
MAKRYLGDTIDVHCGGIDLKFPHHENEIAQSEGSTGKTFCNCWIHNGFVNIGSEKMSKSMGNFLTLSQACPKPNDVRAYRYLVVTSQYRTDLSFTEQAMEGSRNALRRMDKVRNAIQEALQSTDKKDASGSSDILNNVVSVQMENFKAALRDDLSMPRAAACLFALVKAAETELKREGGALDIIGLKAIYDAIEDMDRVFGIFYKVADEKDEEKQEVPEEVMELVGQRAAAKEAKDWELADSLRARITELGFTVKDVKGGEPIVKPVE